MVPVLSINFLLGLNHPGERVPLKRTFRQPVWTQTPLSESLTAFSDDQTRLWF